MKFIVTIPDDILDEEYPEFGEQQVCDELMEILRDNIGGNLDRRITVTGEQSPVFNVPETTKIKKKKK